MTIVRAEYVTIAEATKLLQVSESTLWRWIDQGDLPAYRFGRRRVLIKRDDLQALITPARGNRGAGIRTELDRLGKPTTPEERRQALAALEAARDLKVEMSKHHGRALFSDSTELIREMRDDRTHELS